MKPGDVIADRYRVEEVLPGSGYSDTARARDVALDRPVALKVTRGDPTEAERFRREAAAISRLEHPRLARILDTGLLDDGRAYLVRSWVTGTPLSDVLEQRHVLPVKEAFAIVSSIAETLEYVHRNRVIHRDIKPANVILSEFDGSALLVDFGLLGHLESNSRATQAGEFFGTPLYMSPEQARGQPQTEATDVWGLGVLLYEMIYGDAPYASHGGSPMDVLVAIARGVPVEYPASPKLEPAQRSLLARCLAADPSERPPASAFTASPSGERPTTTDVQMQAPVLQPEVDAGVERQAPGASGASFVWIGALVLLLALAAALALTFGAPALTVLAAVPAGAWIGLALIAAGVVGGLSLKRFLAAKQTPLGERSAKVLVGAAERETLTASIAVDVSHLIHALQAEDEKAFLKQSIAVMLGEYHAATASNDRQSAIMNAALLAERLSNESSPWYVRHMSLLTFVATLTGIVSGLAAITASVVGAFE